MSAARLRMTSTRDLLDTNVLLPQINDRFGLYIAIFYFAIIFLTINFYSYSHLQTTKPLFPKTHLQTTKPLFPKTHLQTTKPLFPKTRECDIIDKAFDLKYQSLVKYSVKMSPGVIGESMEVTSMIGIDPKRKCFIILDIQYFEPYQI